MSDLTRMVESSELLSGDGVHPPDVAATLIYGLGDGCQNVLVVTGPRSRARYHPASAPGTCLRLRIRPGHARRLLGVPLTELADRPVLATDLWGRAAGRLIDDVATLAGTRRPGPPARPTALDAALGELAAGRPVGAAADRLGVGERQLRNVFAQEVGLSPKQVARVVRLRRVLGHRGRDWATVADEAGFFDQAHLISDFRALMGVSPGRFAAGRLPSPAPCAMSMRSAV